MKATGNPVGKAIVAGAKPRESGKIAGRVMPDDKAATPTSWRRTTSSLVRWCSPTEARGYPLLSRMGHDHNVVNHSVSEYMDGQYHTNGMESFWSMTRRGYRGTYRSVIHERLHRYVAEFESIHNLCPDDTVEQLAALIRRMEGRTLPC